MQREIFSYNFDIWIVKLSFAILLVFRSLYLRVQSIQRVNFYSFFEPISWAFLCPLSKLDRINDLYTTMSNWTEKMNRFERSIGWESICQFVFSFILNDKFISKRWHTIKTLIKKWIISFISMLVLKRWFIRSKYSIFQFDWLMPKFFQVLFDSRSK